jgi:hypothetical protein
MGSAKWMVLVGGVTCRSVVHVELASDTPVGVLPVLHTASADDLVPAVPEAVLLFFNELALDKTHVTILRVAYSGPPDVHPPPASLP